MTHIGTDLVYIPRFFQWLSYTDNQLSTLFSVQEIQRLKEILSKAPKTPVCRANGAQFLASRFAAKEAFYKALCSLYSTHSAIKPFTFRSIARFIQISSDSRWGSPYVLFDSIEFSKITGNLLPAVSSRISITHTQDYTMAQVLLEQKI